MGSEWNKNNPEKNKECQKRYREKNLKREKERARRYFKKRYKKILGYEPKDGEVVHHIDMNKSNNNSENLYVYSNVSEHLAGHWSINYLMSTLLEKSIVKFENGRYYLAD